MRKEIKLIIVSGVGMLILALLIISILTSTQYLTVMEVVFTKPENRFIAVMGKVVNGSINYVEGRLTFKIHDEKGPPNTTLQVIYTGYKNVYIHDGAIVVIKGVYRRGMIEATEILTKCPSAYKPETPTEEV